MKTSVKPHSEVKKLSYFVGKWATKGTILPGPWGQGGKFSWTETTKWMKGRFFVIGRWDFKMPAALGGDGEEIFVMGYDARQNVYTFDAFSSQGLHQVSRGTVSGNTWTWTSESIQPVQGKMQPVQQKMTMQVLSPTSYTLKLELSYDGATWVTFMEGKAVKKK
ncbi:MAG TPA: DUF1579 family protein [Candidatus Sulfotelmatobacter sp.]|nr:DUF1579 family protein [Candidatus Sulfotelmatobacter sp.]